MSSLLTFPGQGSQRAGMLHDLPDHPVVAATCAQASDVLGTDVLALDTAARLRSTVAVQLCLLIAGVALSRCLAAEGARAGAVAGLSIGAYPAAVAAGVLPFADALRLVRARAQWMEQAYPHGHGMTAILGLEAAALAPLIDRVRDSVGPVYLANLNAPTQLVIAGALPAMEAVAALALEAGAQAARPIDIAVPSHCALLDDVAARLQRMGSRIAWSAPRLRYFSASAARELRNASRIAEDLLRNVAMPVRWHETMVLARASDVGLVIEMPAGDVLTRLAGPVFGAAIAVSADRTRLDSLVTLMRREADRH
ncbi:malonate decarboxylase epsilon subunit [Cupriavidus gilardii J11]|uniref:Malonyl CoA-acyl carrier protein transacylase n=1 Tax=Cupriavidus gilardii J11 TaxID=936133 RepID=A0A562BUG6_9BURK|nr:malonate decarboxylase subunit epsilon [Cupriavidus gilardii]TWG88832.1 malonate decarboxylase epsilon subunit [Cupriavidus gilardii J11]